MRTQGNRATGQQGLLRPKLVVKSTLKYGKGVFAVDDIRKGEIIHVCRGIRMTLTDLIAKVNSGEEYIDDPLQIGRRTYIDLDEFSRLFNHSCNPTAGMRNVSEIFALRNIKKGEQITYDYSLTIAPTVWEMECKCGSKNCRKTLGDVRSVPSDRIAEYKKVGALQRYMKLLLKEVQEGRYEMPKYELVALEKIKNTTTSN